MASNATQILSRARRSRRSILAAGKSRSGGLHHRCGGGLVGLVAPPLLRGKIASELSQKFHREVAIEQIRLNPYAMTATVRGFLMKERQSQEPALSFDELHINLELQSIFRLSPVIKELRLVKPYINLVRNEDFKYNFQDIIDDLTSGPSGGPTPRFALNNIQLIDGRVEFDDRPEQTKHSISAINIGVPFISSLPSYTDIFVKPSFSANINGAPLHIGGASKPFHSSHESTVDLDIDKLQINQVSRIFSASSEFQGSFRRTERQAQRIL